MEALQVDLLNFKFNSDLNGILDLMVSRDSFHLRDVVIL